MKNILSIQTGVVIFLAVVALLFSRNTILAAQIVNTGDCFTLNDEPAENCPDDSQTPTVTPTPTPTEQSTDQQPTPTQTPTPTESQGNVDEGNIYDPCVNNRCPSPTPTQEPTGQQPTPTITPAPTAPANTGGGGESPSTGGSSSPSVQGASTLAATGMFTDTLMNVVGFAGVALSGLWAMVYAKKS